MEYLVTAAEARGYDAYTSKELGIPEIVLMERAAYGAYQYIVEHSVASLDRAFIILCGYGNNGGDGIALGRMLFQKGINVSVIMLGSDSGASELNALERDIARRYGVPIKALSVSELADDTDSYMRAGSFVIDAMFGIGLSRPLEGDYKRLIEKINDRGAYVYALDVPSGVYADGAGFGNVCIHADVTLTFAFNKLGLTLYPGADAAGRVEVIDIGIDEHSMNGVSPVYRHFTDASDISLPERSHDANKGTCGKLLIIAGSGEISGAALLAAKAAFACGIGMVRVITHERNREVLGTALPEAMYSFYDDDTSDIELDKLCETAFSWADGILIGPGIGMGHTADRLVRAALYNTELPLLVDADAVRLIADDDEYIRHIKSDSARKVVFTPHLGEYSYLTGYEISDIKEHISEYPKRTADELGITLICKDARSIISSCGRKEIYVNTSGNDGMATAGSGDVLAGICAVYMLQSEDMLMACAQAAYLHGLSGDDAAKRLGRRSMNASDIIDSLKDIIKSADMEDTYHDT